MIENNKLKENSFYKDDIIRIIIIIVVALTFMIVTWIKVENNYEKELLDEQNKYTHVPNNDLYKYDIAENNIVFYDLNNSVVSSYKCTAKCNIINNNDMSFTINNDLLVFISDNNKYVLYNISNKKVDNTFDVKPIAIDNTDYAIVLSKGKYGLIDNSGNTKLNTSYNFIKYLDGYFVLADNTGIDILDKEFNKLNSEIITFDRYINIDVQLNGNIITISNGDSTFNGKIYKFDVIQKKMIED